MMQRCPYSMIKGGHGELMKNPLFRSFMEDEENWRCYVEVSEEHKKDTLQRLNKLFHMYYAEIRFIAYMSRLIHYTAINFDRKHRLNSMRYPLTLDQPVKENGDSWIDLVAGEPIQPTTKDVDQQFLSFSLFRAYKRLTAKQKEVLDLFYSEGATDTEIANDFGVSQQAVSKRRKRALKKLRDVVKEGIQ
ncbi:sigma-70 family RNA polymerase sigma factor [Guptibacillus algicola]|uniref:sigma-70 family RNA polymerase sigma factor n=1 Tax=Guptibacillus algicola TaxID=225844 RepID=UPI001CD36CCB|nr:sigma-70 family RNA polymerase sigma factor [Alkalihalobacillus algicola]MCA0988930.1 sigma-70 family RNA polymerase sigma factor [Alkalihalobacillus algicola]